MATEIYELKVSFFQAGQYAQVVFHEKIVDPTEANDYLVAGQLLNALDDGVPSWLLRLQQMMSTECYISSVRAKRIWPTGGNSAVQFFQVGDVPGQVAEEIEAQQTAMVIIWLSDTTPDITGRNFIPGTPDDALEASRWEADAYTRANNFIAKHLPGFSVAAGVFEPVIFNRATHVARLMSHGYLSPKPGTLRKRELAI